LGIMSPDWPSGCWGEEMRRKLKELVDRLVGRSEASAEPGKRAADLRHATALLLFEVARMDQKVESVERALVERLLHEQYGLDEPALHELMVEAEQSAGAATSYHPFTSELRASLTLAEKVALIEQMWAVALADGELDMHEEHLIRKVAGLLYVSHQQFIAAKHRASEQ